MEEEKNKEAKERTMEEILKNKNEWTKEIIQMLTDVKEESEELSIYKVPCKLRKVKEDAYNPRVVSIGPFHKGEADLVAMESHKRRYMLSIFQQTNDVAETANCIEKCTNVIKGLDKQVRGNYAVEDHKKNNIKKPELANIMLLDGCFILELFLRFHQHSLKMTLRDQSPDPIFKNAWMIPALRHDLSLLENQIPFFVLQKLYDTIRPRYFVNNTPVPNTVTYLALKFFQPRMHEAIKEDHVDGPADCKHLLHLLQKFFIPSKKEIQHGGVGQLTIELGPKDQYISTGTTSNEENEGSLFRCLPIATKKNRTEEFHITCASKLLEAGIEFKAGSMEDHLLDITFKNGKITIPQVFIDETTDSLFRNLIAFEPCHLQSSHHITSYAILMKSLIRSKEDIKLLKKRGIINESWKGDNYFVHFESILEHVNPKGFYFHKLFEDVSAYSGSCHWAKLKVFWTVRFQTYIGSLYDTYFSSPWSFIAFVAALAAFGLTVTQTYYSIHPRQ